MGDPLVITLVLSVNGAISLGLLSAGLVLWWRTRNFIASARRASGVVIGRQKMATSRYSPIVRFTAADGSTVEFTDRGSRRHKVGDRVEVLYDRRDFARARIRKTAHLFYVPAVILGGVGAVFPVIECAVLVIWGLLYISNVPR